MKRFPRASLAMVAFCFLAVGGSGYGGLRDRFAPGKSAESFGCKFVGPDYPGAVVFGKPYNVPAMTFRLYKGKSEEPFSGAEVSVQYCWRWLKYPYPEHDCGAYDSATERLVCFTNDEGVVIVPEHTVNPRGWCEIPKCERSLFGAKGEPYFEEVHVDINNHDYCAGFTLTERKIRGMKPQEKAIHVPECVLTNGYGVPLDRKTGKPIKQ